MKFGIIYSVDIYVDAPFEPREHTLSDFEPKRLKQRGVWRKTETSKNMEQDHPCYETVAHAKWVALLTKEQLKQFLDMFLFEYRSCCDTAGALGMPGMDPWYGCAPAWSFDVREDMADVNIYLTPWPEVKQKTGVSNREESWNRIKRALECAFVA